MEKLAEMLGGAGEAVAPADVPDERLLTRDEVERIFGVTRRSLELYAVQGGGPKYHKIKRAVRYAAGDVRAWLQAHRVENTSQRAGG